MMSTKHLLSCIHTCSQCHLGPSLRRSYDTTLEYFINVSTPCSPGSQPVGVHLEVGVFASLCQYFSESEKQWRTDGMVPLAETNASRAVCRTRHLTAFAAGLFVPTSNISFKVPVSIIQTLTVWSYSPDKHTPKKTLSFSFRTVLVHQAWLCCWFVCWAYSAILWQLQSCTSWTSWIYAGLVWFHSAAETDSTSTRFRSRLAGSKGQVSLGHLATVKMIKSEQGCLIGIY